MPDTRYPTLRAGRVRPGRVVDRGWAQSRPLPGEGNTSVAVVPEWGSCWKTFDL